MASRDTCVLSLESLAYNDMAGVASILFSWAGPHGLYIASSSMWANRQITPVGVVFGSTSHRKVLDWRSRVVAES